MFHQPQLEQVLGNRLDSLPNVQVHRGVEFTDLRETPDGVVVDGRRIEVGASVSGPRTVMPTDERHQLTARYVVGCDGANSTVREYLDLPVTDLGFFYDWLIVDVVLNEEREFRPTNLQICDPARSTTVVSGGPGRRRWEFMRLPTESIDEFNDEAASWRLLEPWDVTPENARLERHAVYTFQARWADEWRAGKVLLAGDAAHQMPPFAGQGMCAGIRDAANLAWKLDLVLNGHAADSLLGSYGLERRPSVEQAIRLSMELGMVICVPDPEAAAARDAAMIPGARDGQLADLPPLPGIASGITLDGDAVSGELFPQAHVAVDGERTLLDDAVGAGWRLFTVDSTVASDVDSDLRTWFEAIGGRIVTIAKDGDLDDVDRRYGDWFAEHDLRTVLQWPDFFVFGSGSDRGSADRLLLALRTSLETGTVSQAGTQR